MAKRTRQKIPIGAGTYFVLVPSTLCFELTDSAGEHVADLLVNASGYGAIVTVPPGYVPVVGQNVPTKISPVQAVELLRRCNLYRLSAGLPQHVIPPALIKRAKSDTMPGIEALVPFPGQHKQYFAGVGTWADTGLWVSARGECALEMQSTSGYIRKMLSLEDAAVWLRTNGHEPPWGYVPGSPATTAPPPPPPDTWEIVTRGDRRAGSTADAPIIETRGVVVTKETAAAKARELKAKAAGERELRHRVSKAPTISPPPISPPVKERAPSKPPRKRRSR